MHEKKASATNKRGRRISSGIKPTKTHRIADKTPVKTAHLDNLVVEKKDKPLAKNKKPIEVRINPPLYSWWKVENLRPPSSEIKWLKIEYYKSMNYLIK